MRTNPVRRALKAGHTVVGSEISRIRSPEVARLYALAGFDFVFIDMEHSSFGLETVADMITAARAAGIVPIVRIPQAEYPFACRVLDQGCRESSFPASIRRSRSAISSRGCVIRPTAFAGLPRPRPRPISRPSRRKTFIESNNRETLCIIQIERREALDYLDEMLSFPGVDVACLGYMDFSVDLGIPGQTRASADGVDHRTDHRRLATVTVLPPASSGRRWSRLSIGCKRGYASFPIRRNRSCCRKPPRRRCAA